MEFLSALTLGLGSLGAIALRQKYQREQNKYNSPKEQRKRFGEAGMSTNLAYGGGAGNQSSMPQVDPALGTANIISAYQASKFQNEQIGLIKEEARNKRAEADLKEEERDWYFENVPQQIFNPRTGEHEDVSGPMRFRQYLETRHLMQMDEKNITTAQAKIAATQSEHEKDRIVVELMKSISGKQLNDAQVNHINRIIKTENDKRKLFDNLYESVGDDAQFMRWLAVIIDTLTNSLKAGNIR